MRSGNGRLLVTEVNNLGLFDSDGQPVFTVTHKALHATFGQFMGAFAINFASGMFAGLATSGMIPGYSISYYPGVKFGNPAVAKVAQNFTYILTYVQDEEGTEVGLVKVNRNTGATDAAIKLGDRTPMFATDEQRARLFFVRDDQFVECYSF
jgi:hypothetical protein